ncbi:MAG: GAF domain-containing protein [Gemmatimonadota bacterium]
MPVTSAGVESEHAVLQAVLSAATAFLRSSELTDNLHTLLSDIGTATGASRACIYESESSPGITLAGPLLRAEWTAPGMDAVIAPARLQPATPAGMDLAPWYTALRTGEPFAGVVTDASGVLSMAAAPIFVDEDIWGVIGLADRATPRTWTSVEVEALSAAAVVVGAAIRRRRMEAALREATVKAQLAADIGEVVTRAGDTIQQMLEACSAAIVNRLQPDLVRIWMMSEDLECLLACAASGAASIQQTDGPELELATPELLAIARSSGPIMWRDGLPALWPGCEEVYREAGLRAGVGFPLVTNGRVAGVAIMLSREDLTRAAIDALESVTDEIALAIERHHAEGAYTRIEGRYRRLVAATVEGIVIHDGKRVVDANPSFAAMLGYTLAEVIGMHPFDFIAPEYHDVVRANLISNYQKPYEVEGIHRDGTRFPVELKGSDYFDQGMKLRVAAVRDISDRRAVQRAAEQLREEQLAREAAERTRAQAEFLDQASRILASSLDTSTTLKQLAHLAIPALADYCVVSTVDEGFVERVAVVHADPAREQLLRETVSTWPEVFPDSHPIFAALSANRSYLASDVSDEVVRTLAVTPEHLEHLRALGARSVVAVPISSAGVIMGSIIMSSTQPGRRYGDDDLALAEEFAHRAALALQAARSYHRSQAASRARDEMLAIVAHDLRNPLNAILMGSELALELSAPDAPGVRQLGIIRRSAEHMNGLIRDLLDASRIDSGHMELERSLLAPADLLREAYDMLAPLAAHETIDLSLDIAAELPPVSVDRGRLLQVLSNLVGNALKFTPKSGAICVSARSAYDDAAGGGTVRISVSDTGSGIPGDQLPHIFARGWQGRRGDRRGIGLGLAIATGIVEAHGGRIWAESKVGEGSTFMFTLPAEGV